MGEPEYVIDDIISGDHVEIWYKMNKPDNNGLLSVADEVPLARIKREGEQDRIVTLAKLQNLLGKINSENYQESDDDKNKNMLTRIQQLIQKINSGQITSDAQLEAEKNALKAKHNETMAELNRKHAAEIEELNAKITDLNQKLAAKDIQLNTATEEIDRLKSELKELKQQLAALEQQIKNKETEMESKVAEAKTEGIIEGSKMSQTEANTAQQKEIDRIRGEANQASAELASVRSQLAISNANANNANTELANVKQELAESKTTLDTKENELRNAISKYEAEQREREKDKTKHDAELKQLKDQYSLLEAKIASYESDIKKNDEQIKKLQSEIDNLNKINASLQDRLRDANAKAEVVAASNELINDYLKQIKLLKQTNLELEKELATYTDEFNEETVRSKHDNMYGGGEGEKLRFDELINDAGKHMKIVIEIFRTPPILRCLGINMEGVCSYKSYLFLTSELVLTRKFFNESFSTLVTQEYNHFISILKSQQNIRLDQLYFYFYNLLLLTKHKKGNETFENQILPLLNDFYYYVLKKRLYQFCKVYNKFIEMQNKKNTEPNDQQVLIPKVNDIVMDFGKNSKNIPIQFSNFDLTKVVDTLNANYINVTKDTLVTNHNNINDVVTFIRERGNGYDKNQQLNVRYKIEIDSHTKDLTVGFNDLLENFYKANVLTKTNLTYPYKFKYGPFTDVYDPSTSNSALVDSTTFNDNIYQKLADGNPVCIIGYGPSGSGKTSSLVYLKQGNTEDTGVLILLANKLANNYTDLELEVVEFRKDTNTKVDLKQIDSTKDYGSEKDVKISGMKFTVSGRSWVTASSTATTLTDVVLNALSAKNRLTQSTPNNPESSRSHLIFKLKFSTTNKSTTLFLCDFAGVENMFNCDDPNVIEEFENIKKHTYKEGLTAAATNAETENRNQITNQIKTAKEKMSLIFKPLPDDITIAASLATVLYRLKQKSDSIFKTINQNIENYKESWKAKEISDYGVISKEKIYQGTDLKDKIKEMLSTFTLQPYAVVNKVHDGPILDAVDCIRNSVIITLALDCLSDQSASKSDKSASKSDNYISIGNIPNTGIIYVSDITQKDWNQVITNNNESSKLFEIEGQPGKYKPKNLKKQKKTICDFMEPYFANKGLNLTKDLKFISELSSKDKKILSTIDSSDVLYTYYEKYLTDKGEITGYLNKHKYIVYTALYMYKYLMLQTDDNIKERRDLLENILNAKLAYDFYTKDSATSNSSINVSKTFYKDQCDARVQEGIFINNSVAQFRHFIGNTVLSGNKSVIPKFVDECLPYQCNPLFIDCFGKDNYPVCNENGCDYQKNPYSRVGEYIKGSVSAEDFNNITFCIFTVINLSINANDPPPTPYIDISKLQTCLSRFKFMQKIPDYNFVDVDTKPASSTTLPPIGKPSSETPKKTVALVVSEELTAAIEELKNHYLMLPVGNDGEIMMVDDNDRYRVRPEVVRQIYGKIHAIDDEIGKMKNNYDSNTELLTSSFINEIYDKLFQLIRILNNVNATSILGALDFTDMISKYGLNENICSIPIKSVVKNPRPSGTVVKQTTNTSSNEVLYDTTKRNFSLGDYVYFTMDKQPKLATITKINNNNNTVDIKYNDDNEIKPGISKAQIQMAKVQHQKTPSIPTNQRPSSSSFRAKKQLGGKYTRRIKRSLSADI